MNTFQHSKKSGMMAISAGLAVASALAIAPSAQAVSLSLDFDAGPNGSSLLYNADGSLQLDQWADLGVTLSVESGRNGAVGLLNTYDTDSWGRDNDLKTGSDYGTAAQGNVLIIQEEHHDNISNGQYVADDEWAGGNIGFNFDSAISFTSFSMLDIDDNGSGIRVEGFNEGVKALDIDIDSLINQHFAANGNSQGSTFTNDGVTITQVGTKRGNNSMYQFDLDEAFFADKQVQNVEFTYPGSGAIAGIEWRKQQEDSQEIPEPSVIGGLLMLGYLGARKYL